MVRRTDYMAPHFFYCNVMRSSGIGLRDLDLDLGLGLQRLCHGSCGWAACERAGALSLELVGPFGPGDGLVSVRPHRRGLLAASG